MAFQKIPKEEWLKLSKEEQDYFNLEFNKSVEKRRIITIAITRGIAVGLVIVLFFIGFVQLKVANSANQVIDKYGANGYCYLCGQYTLRMCQCLSFTPDAQPKDMNNYSLELAQYNTRACALNNNTLTNFYPIEFNISKLT